VPIILATQEAEIGGLLSKARVGKNMRPDLENKLKPKRLGEEASGRMLV
jgi:hypothetical protein